MLLLFGLSVLVFLFGGILWRDSVRWRYLAMHYAGEGKRPIEERNFQSAVLLGFIGYKSLTGILKIGVHETGVSFRVLAPFSLFHPPLFIPYDNIRGWDTSWYLDAHSIQLEFRKAPDVKMVVPAEQAEWIRSFADHKLVLHRKPPPEGKAGQGWRALVLTHAGLSLFAVIFTIVFVLVR